MQIEIDQSGKIEQTSFDTILALTNDIKFTIILKKRDKRLIEKEFKKNKQKRLHVQITFATLLLIIIRKSKIKKSVLIDTEYPGYNNFIENFIESKLKNHCPTIKFGFVGKESKSDILASQVAHKKIKPNYIVSANEVLRICLPKKKSGNA